MTPRQTLSSTMAIKEAAFGGRWRQKNPFRRPFLLLLILLVGSWTDAQQLQQRGEAAQGRPGAFSLHLGGQRAASSGIDGGRGVGIPEGRPSSVLNQPHLQEPTVLFKQLPQSPFSAPALQVQPSSSIARGSSKGFDNIHETTSFESPNLSQNNKAIVNQTPAPQKKVHIKPQRALPAFDERNIREPLEKTEEELQEEIFQEQAKNAHYSFSSSVNDELSDQLVMRKETRDGLNVKGSYSYADGYYQRTVYYEADENGYRVTGEEMKYIGDGPQPNPQGAAHVKSEFGSAQNQYSITAADIESFRTNKKKPTEI